LNVDRISPSYGIACRLQTEDLLIAVVAPGLDTSFLKTTLELTIRAYVSTTNSTNQNRVSKLSRFLDLEAVVCSSFGYSV
jgi:hypothetical protein